MSKYDELLKYSNPEEVYDKAREIFGPKTFLSVSSRQNKKYMIYDPYTDKFIHFGQMGYEDFTKHLDKNKRNNYLTRTANMRGNWKDNPYSPNNLSRNLLW